MPKVIATHWLTSPKRAKIFGDADIQTYFDPATRRVVVVLVEA